MFSNYMHNTITGENGIRTAHNTVGVSQTQAFSLLTVMNNFFKHSLPHPPRPAKYMADQLPILT